MTIKSRDKNSVFPNPFNRFVNGIIKAASESKKYNKAKNCDSFSGFMLNDVIPSVANL